MAGMGGFSQESIGQQAQHIWTMLDEMAASNPDGYKKFIDKHIKEGKEYMEPPTPHMCIKTVMCEPRKMPFYVNVCGWNRLPMPKTPEDAVPVMGTAVHDITDDSGKVGMTSVAFNPKILEEYGRNSKNLTDQDTLVNLAIDYIHDLQKIKLSRQYKILGEETLHKGELNFIQQSFKQKDKGDKEIENQITELEKTFGPMPTNAKDSLLNKLSNISVNEDTDSQFQKNNSGQKDDGMIFPSQSEKKKGLIEEISTEKVKDRLKVPEYKILTDKGDNGQIERVIVKVELPNVKSVGECELDLCQDDLQLAVEDKYKLKLKLPCKIDDSEASAKFNKKTSCLTITAPSLDAIDR